MFHAWQDGEEMVYDTDELVIEGDDGDAEYEGDTEQTLPEFLESILSLWSSSPAPPKVLNGHRYGDTQVAAVPTVPRRTNGLQIQGSDFGQSQGFKDDPTGESETEPKRPLPSWREEPCMLSEM